MELIRTTNQHKEWRLFQRSSDAHLLRANNPNTFVTEREIAERSGVMAMMYTIPVIRINPNIVRTRAKFGESWSTISAGTNDMIAMIVSEIQ